LLGDLSGEHSDWLTLRTIAKVYNNPARVTFGRLLETVIYLAALATGCLLLALLIARQLGTILGDQHLKGRKRAGGASDNLGGHWAYSHRWKMEDGSCFPEDRSATTYLKYTLPTLLRGTGP